MPKVSIIIPAYNALEYLPQALASVDNQGFNDFEVIIINDGSSDGIEEWFKQHIQDAKYRLITQTNQGISGARNRGVQASQGDYIAFLDADDMWAPSKLEQQVACLDHNPTTALVHTWLAMVDVTGKATGRVLQSQAQGQVYESLLLQNDVACASVMVRRHCFEQVGEFDRDLLSMEDWDMWIRMAQHYQFAVIPEALTFYRQVPTSLTKDCRQMERAFDLVIEKSFQAAPAALKGLRPLTCGYANFCLAWKALQSVAQDARLASHYHLKGLRAAPKLLFSRENLRLSLAIAMMATLGGNGYDQALDYVNGLRRRTA
ncbi:MAG: glycosyltransferase family 2 protein [Synechococcales cyanobacterium RM1_1_8]|nr:glycosyltransferase family 2 protein [Synechococcales cyanobacterium RM1_1_8]